MGAEIVISVNNVSVTYRQRSGLFKPAKSFEALSNVSFDLYCGETLGIVGRNGIGKTTLLKVLAGIIRPDKGKIINHRNASVSLLALQAGFDSELSGYDNAVLGGMLLGYSRKDVEAKLDEIAAFSELGAFMDQPIKTYSSGMRSRLGFSVALYASPDVLLLDEVLSVGDREFKKKAEAAITEKIRSDQTVVLVSHSESQVERLCDRTVRLG